MSQEKKNNITHTQYIPTPTYIRTRIYIYYNANLITLKNVRGFICFKRYTRSHTPFVWQAMKNIGEHTTPNSKKKKTKSVKNNKENNNSSYICKLLQSHHIHTYKHCGWYSTLRNLFGASSDNVNVRQVCTFYKVLNNMLYWRSFSLPFLLPWFFFLS